MNDFLSKNYEIPAMFTNYMKLEEGKSRIRIMSSAIVGYELWVDKKPIRKVNESEFTDEQLQKADINTFTGKRRLPDHFWAFIVYSYKDKRIMILELKQKTIQKAIIGLINDQEWGSPFKYDIEIDKIIDDKKTTYSVIPKPHKEVEPEIKKEYENMTIELNALFNGADPFKSDELPKVEAKGKKK